MSATKQKMVVQCPCCGTRRNQRHAAWCPQPPRMKLPADSENEKATPGSLHPAGSMAHVHMNILTPNGNTATILGDPNMPRKTMDALAQMIDAVAKAANDGTLKVP